MASSIIHIAVANEINKTIKRNPSSLLIGTIAPDISKHIGKTKKESHFLDFGGDIPNLDRFLEKYKKNLNNDFVLGYYIHLYTDYLWFKYFIPEIVDKNLITKLDGTVVPCSGEMMSLYIYNDYTNLNIQLLDEYNMDLKIFYNPIPKFEPIIEEIPMDKIHIIVDAAGKIIEETKVHKDMVFNVDNIKQFISTSVELILSELEKLGI